MDLPATPPPPPSSATSENSNPTTPSKLRLMCSYGGHIVPRAQGKSLSYSGGETRIVAVDRRTTAASLSALIAHLSRSLYHNRLFHLKYQLPNEDLDSLISVTTDEDLQNMLEEHDRITSANSPTPMRIRLFLFPVKPESLGSVLLDPKADCWFTDALNGATIVQRVHSADGGFALQLMGSDSAGRSSANAIAQPEAPTPVPAPAPAPATPAESLSNCGGGCADSKGTGGPMPESSVLETTHSSFGSTNSSISMSNTAAAGAHSEDAGAGAGVFEKKIRVPSSASIESEYSAASAVHSKTGVYQEPSVQVSSGVSSYLTEVDSSPSDPQSVLQTPNSLSDPQSVLQTPNTLSDPQSVLQTPKSVQLPAYQLPHHLDGKPPPQPQPQPQPQYEVRYHYVQGDSHYAPQYQPVPSMHPSYYPVYQVPMNQQMPLNQQIPLNHYPMNQPYQVCYMPVRSIQNHGMPMQYSLMDNTTVAFSRPPLPPQTAMTPPLTSKDSTPVPSQSIPESAPKMYQNVPAPKSTPVPAALPASVPAALPASVPAAQPVSTAGVPSSNHATEYDDVGYSQIYKTQPPSALPLQYENVPKGVNMMMPESPSLGHVTVKQTALHPQ